VSVEAARGALAPARSPARLGRSFHLCSPSKQLKKSQGTREVIMKVAVLRAFDGRRLIVENDKVAGIFTERNLLS
jgi:hypothetical protein